MNEILIKLKNAKGLCGFMSSISGETKNQALNNIANAIESNCQKWLRENEIDVWQAKEAGKNAAFIDRLKLDESRVRLLSSSIRQIALLPDAIGQVIESFTTADGLRINKMCVPFGLLAAVYEARPNVTADIVALCIKTGNVCVLKGGKEALKTNECLVDIIKTAYNGILPADAITLLPADRKTIDVLMNARGIVDLIIPRGGKELIDYVVENSIVPVIETGAGICHIFVEKTADLGKAINIIVNAKTSRPSVCNAAETLLVDKKIAYQALPAIANALAEKGVIMRGEDDLKEIINIQPLTNEGYAKEYGDLEISVKIVENTEEAIAHINIFGTHHSDCIITEDKDAASKFKSQIDSACVYVNASTRFTDGGCFGFGAEIGISTQKMHARGPMGLKEITTYKYIIEGDGQIR